MSDGRFTEDDLRRFVESPWRVTDRRVPARLAAEVLELRDRVTELEATLARAETLTDRYSSEAKEEHLRATELDARLSRVTDLFERWAAEENQHRLDGYLGIAEGFHVAIEELREAVHGDSGGIRWPLT